MVRVAGVLVLAVLIYCALTSFGNGVAAPGREPSRSRPVLPSRVGGQEASLVRDPVGHRGGAAGGDVEAAATSTAGNDTWPVKVICVGTGGGRLAGIEVRLRTKGESYGGIVKLSDGHGEASFLAERGDILHAYGRDPKRYWTLADSCSGERGIVPAGSPEMTLRFVPCYVAFFQLTGDEVIEVATGECPPGFHLDLDWPHEDCGDQRRRLFLRASEPTMETGPPLLEVFAYGKMRGRCRFQVPVRRADLAATPTQCDMAQFPLCPAERVIFKVTDFDGNAVALDDIWLSAAHGPIQSGRAGEVLLLPQGHLYRVELGMFPVRWESDHAAALDMRSPSGALRSVEIALPVPVVVREVVLLLNDKPLPEDHPADVAVVGEWGTPNKVHGRGASRTFFSGELGPMCLPLGAMRWELTTGCVTYRADIVVDREPGKVVIRFYDS